MKLLLAATLALVALPVSYEWVMAVVIPFIADVLWQSAEAIAHAQVLGVGLLIFVLIPIVTVVGWLARKFI